METATIKKISAQSVNRWVAEERPFILFTRRFPTATFTIKSGTPRNEPYVSAPNVDVQGERTLKGIKAGLSFPATVHQAPDGTITAKARFDSGSDALEHHLWVHPFFRASGHAPGVRYHPHRG